MDYPEAPLSEELAIDWPEGKRWGVVLSHDIDHLGLREHLIDGFLLRYVVNVARQNLTGRHIRPLRMLDGMLGILLSLVGRDRWDVLDELLAAERAAGVKSTWFVAVRRGLGIAYDRDGARSAIERLLGAGQEVGLHGQSPTSAEGLAAEVADLRKLAGHAGHKVRGLRMHYLRLTPQVLDGMEQSGLRYDSTVMDRSRLDPDEHPLPAPRLVRPGILEIPLHVMDSTLFSVTGLDLDLDEARDYVSRLSNRAAERRLLLTINLHPNFYSQQSPEVRSWYRGVLADLTARSDVFVTDFRGLLPRIRIP